MRTRPITIMAAISLCVMLTACGGRNEYRTLRYEYLVPPQAPLPSDYRTIHYHEHGELPGPPLGPPLEIPGLSWVDSAEQADIEADVHIAPTELTDVEFVVETNGDLLGSSMHGSGRLVTPVRVSITDQRAGQQVFVDEQLIDTGVRGGGGVALLPQAQMQFNLAVGQARHNHLRQAHAHGRAVATTALRDLYTEQVGVSYLSLPATSPSDPRIGQAYQIAVQLGLIPAVPQIKPLYEAVGFDNYLPDGEPDLLLNECAFIGLITCAIVEGDIGRARHLADQVRQMNPRISLGRGIDWHLAGP